MKTLLATLGLAALVASCSDKTNVSTIGENKILTKPAGCETVKDIRYECYHGGCAYQLLCEQDGGMVLYNRDSTEDEWTSISLRQ